MKKISKYPEYHTSSDWTRGMSLVVKDILKREHGLTTKLPSELVNKVAATHLGHDLSTYNYQKISRQTIREIAGYLLGKARKSHEEQVRYQMESSHAWARKSYDYITRRIEDQIIVEYQPTTTIDTLVIGDFDAVMQVPRVIKFEMLPPGKLNK